MNLVPVPSEPETATCANCGAALVADQRYCLACGHPASPVRLAFLDVLQQPEQGRPNQQGWVSQSTLEMTPNGYAPVYEQPGVNAWLRRNSGLMGLLTVLILCLVVGLLVGHWVTQGNKSAGPQVIKVEGLSSGAVAGTTTTPATTTTKTETEANNVGEEKVSKAEEEKAAKEVAKETAAEKAPPAKPKTVAPKTIKKLSSTSGRKHQEEINALGTGPIETG